LIQQQRTLINKIPEIQAALQSLQYLKKQKEQQKPIDLHFQLSDSIFANAEIPPATDDSNDSNTVLLWLGANVMLEYNYDEADALLNKNLNNARITLKSLESDIEFLKDQITISEVNIARLHNYGIALKKQSQQQLQQHRATQQQSSSQPTQQAAGIINAGNASTVTSNRSFAQAAKG